MNKSSANLLVAVFDDFVCIKICGRANFTTSLDFKKVFAELEQRGFSHFVLDLTECLIMDSTFLGVLSGIGLRFAQKNSDGCPHVVKLLNPNARISDLLENLGVAHLFKVINATKPVGETEFQPIDPHGQEASRAEVTRTCLEAHKVLMQICPENVTKFKDVAQFLAEDLKKIESAHSK
jgi:anti-sigma B factor antagonist